MELIRSSVIHFEANNIKLTRSIGGVFFIEFETNYKIYSGDTVRIVGNDNKTYSFIVSEINKTSYKADHISYELKRYLLFNELNRPDFGYINLTACIALLVPILASKGFTLTTNFDTGQAKYTKDITFADDNLLSALQKICDVFKLELKFEDSTVLLAERLGAIEPVQTINAGVNSNPITKKISRDNIVSVVYPKGSGENLPEYYPFSELRPITFDMATKSIPSYDFNELKVSNAETIANYGTIEKPVQFEDVRIVSKRAVIDSFSVDGDKCILKVIKANLGANLMDSVGVSLLNNKTTLVITKNLKLLENVRLAEYAQDDTHYIFKYAKEQSGIDVSTWDFANGTLILFGYIRQDDYDAAKDKLIAEAQKYLDTNKAPEIEYSVDMTYFIDYIDISSLAFDIGDTVKLIDETEDINTDVRVIEYTFDINKGYFTTVKFSNFINKMPYDIIQEQIDLRNSLEKQKTFSDGLAIRLRDTLNKHELLVKSNFYGEENEYVRIGAQDRNFVITGLTITPDDGLKGKISWTSCQFQLVVSDSVFTIAAGNQTLSNGIYFLEVKTVNGGNTGEIVILTTKKAGEDAGYTYYPFGAIEVTTDKPTEIATSYGLTLIDGGLIKTQSITADQIQAETITADKLIKTLALVASQLIQAGNVKIGKDSSGNGYLEIGTPTDTYYLKFNQGTGVFDIQANLKVAKDENSIEFVDSQITLSDYGYDSPFQNYQKKVVTFQTQWIPGCFNTIRFYFDKFHENLYTSAISITTRSTTHGNVAELYSTVDTDGSGYSGIKLDCYGYHSDFLFWDSVYIKSVFLWNSPHFSTYTSYLNFSKPICLPSLVAELLANYPNGTLGRDANGNLKFKQNDVWFDVMYRPKNTTSTSKTTTTPTFPESPADGDYHEHTYTGEVPNQKYLYIYKFGRWIRIA